MKINELLTEKHRLLLSCTAKNTYSSDLFNGMDIDTESTFVLRAVSFIASKNEWKNVPENIEIRLRGMIRCYHIKYQTEFNYAVKLLEVWNKNSIKYFVFRSAALKLGGYTEDCVPVGHMSVFVTASDREKAIELALQSGFSKDSTVAGLFIKDTCGVLFCDNSECFGNNNSELILNEAETVCVNYQHDYKIDIPIPSPENLFKLCAYQIAYEFCNTLDINRLFYLVWMGIIIQKHSTANITVPEINPHTVKYIKIGTKLKSAADKSKGIKRLFLRAVKKITKIYLNNLLKKGRLFLYNE